MQHTTISPLLGLTTTAPSTTNPASMTRPISVVESYYDSATGGWYRKYSDGWIEQGGYVSVPGGMGNRTAYSVTFGTAFTEAPVMIHCCQKTSGSGTGFQGLYGVLNVSATGFSYCTGYTGNANSTGFYWTAKGI